MPLDFLPSVVRHRTEADDEWIRAEVKRSAPAPADATALARVVLNKIVTTYKESDHAAVVRMFDSKSDSPLRLEVNDAEAMGILMDAIHQSDPHPGIDRIVPLLITLHTMGMRMELAKYNYTEQPFAHRVLESFKRPTEAVFAWLAGLLTPDAIDRAGHTGVALYEEEAQKSSYFMRRIIFSTLLIHEPNEFAKAVKRAALVMRVYTESRSYDGDTPERAMHELDEGMATMRRIGQESPYLRCKVLRNAWAPLIDRAQRSRLMLGTIPTGRSAPGIAPSAGQILHENGDDAIRRLIRALLGEMSL